MRNPTRVRKAFLKLLLLAVLAGLPSTALAQFGHPLKGTWSGQWGKDSQRLLLDIDWDGKEIIGTINPGPNAATIKSTTFDYTDPTKWKVKMTAEGKDATGKAVAITVDGVLENIGAYYKLLHGTWQQGSVKGEFTVTRN